MGNNLIVTCMQHILTEKHVIEVGHRSRFGDTCHWTHGSTQSQCFSMGRKSPPKLPLTMGGCGPPSNAWLLGPTTPHTPNAMSIEPAVSSGLTLRYPYTLLWDGPFPTPKLPLLVGGGSGPPSNTWWLSPTPPHMPNGISIGPAVFAGYLVVTWHTHRPTDRRTDHGNVVSNRPHLYATHIRCGLKIKNQSTEGATRADYFVLTL